MECSSYGYMVIWLYVSSLYSFKKQANIDMLRTYIFQEIVDFIIGYVPYLEKRRTFNATKDKRIKIEPQK